MKKRSRPAGLTALYKAPSADPNRKAGETGRPWPIREAANYLGVSTKTLSRGRDAGTVAIVKMGKLLYVPDAELCRLVAEGVQTKPTV